MLYIDVTNYDESDLTSKMEPPDPIPAMFDLSCTHHQILLNGTCVGKYFLLIFNYFCRMFFFDLWL